MSKKQAGMDGKPAQEESPASDFVEWLVVGVATAIVLLLVGLVIYQDLARGDQPVALQIEPRLEAVRQQNGQFYLPVEVINQGDLAAEGVRVALALGEAERRERSEFTIQLLPGGSAVRAVLVFQHDPRQGELLVESISFVEP